MKASALLVFSQDLRLIMTTVRIWNVQEGRVLNGCACEDSSRAWLGSSLLRRTYVC